MYRGLSSTWWSTAGVNWPDLSTCHWCWVHRACRNTVQEYPRVHTDRTHGFLIHGLNKNKSLLPYCKHSETDINLYGSTSLLQRVIWGMLTAERLSEGIAFHNMVHINSSAEMTAVSKTSDVCEGLGGKQILTCEGFVVSKLKCQN